MKQCALSILFTGLIHFFGCSQTIYEEYSFQGKIGSNSINLTFIEPDHFFNQFEGYYITGQNVRHTFIGEEGVFEGKIVLKDLINDQVAGFLVFFDLDYSKSSINGTWYSKDYSKHFDVVLIKKNN